MRKASIYLFFIFLIACEKDVGKGEVLFCTNSYLINCPFLIEISIDNKYVDTLTAESEFTSTDCICEDSGNLGLLIELEPGYHSYSAHEVNCAGTNRTSTWTGSIEVTKVNCVTIFLDVNE